MQVIAQQYPSLIDLIANHTRNVKDQETVLARLLHKHSIPAVLEAEVTFSYLTPAARRLWADQSPRRNVGTLARMIPDHVQMVEESMWKITYELISEML